MNITRIRAFDRTLDNEELTNPDMIGVPPTMDTTPINLDMYGYVVFNELDKGVGVYESGFVKFLLQNATGEDWEKYLAKKIFNRLTK